MKLSSEFCRCRVTYDDGSTVIGSGRQDDPYIIEVGGIRCVEDSDGNVIEIRTEKNCVVFGRGGFNCVKESNGEPVDIVEGNCFFVDVSTAEFTFQDEDGDNFIATDGSVFGLFNLRSHSTEVFGGGLSRPELQARTARRSMQELGIGNSPTVVDVSLDLERKESTNAVVTLGMSVLSDIIDDSGSTLGNSDEFLVTMKSPSINDTIIGKFKFSDETGNGRNYSDFVFAKEISLPGSATFGTDTLSFEVRRLSLQLDYVDNPVIRNAFSAVRFL